MQNVIIKIVEFPEEFTAIKEIRILVFQKEQRIETVLDFDGQDEICDHLIAYLGTKPIGTVRIRYLENKIAKIERLAVLSQARGNGIGTQITQKALQLVATKNISEAVIHSQEYVKDLYQRLNFIQEGESFEEAGIRHIKMKKIIE
ncbi:GNAT family N-acetyltransferase [Fortiea sp. LEGE XX443]|uniref:GNAT family N-acetyltransferase n=1 Tax=Fortiea sp. LEGE XX443 TaxID=1828611 RepID=UPI001882C0F1|nr:GNAT family N-acetyltransferase [Fortiea sp. LEGE XX443]MBE9007176.1 GNAT family N-acetyltransferase [Fortiea sp. LEGE XX443]